VSRVARHPSAHGAALVLVAVGLVYWQADLAGVQDPSVLRGFWRETLKTVMAAGVLFGLSGYGVARLLLPPEWQVHVLAFTLPVGAAVSTLALTLLGLAHVPLEVSLGIVLAAGALLCVGVAWRRPERPGGGAPPVLGVLVPIALAAAVGVMAIMPALRAGFPTVQGSNGDAILAVGTADFLSHAPPTEVRPELGLDRVPILWRSKLPIYYGLAGITALAGQDEITAFSSTGGVVLGMFALGLFLFAFHALRAPPLVALLAAFLVPFSRIAIHVSIHTYYNQLWAMFALPFVLLTGWRFLSKPDRSSAALFGLFTALALFTYPLLLPFPALFLAVVAWQRRDRAREWARSIRLPRWAYVVAAIIAIPVVLVLARGVVEKVVPAISALLPWGDLTGWGGGTVLPYLPFGQFFGIEIDAQLLQIAAMAVVFAGALLGLRGAPREVGVAFGVLLGFALLAGLYVRLRENGELFWFKDMSFVGPLVLLLAIVGLASLRGRVAQASGLLAVALLTVALFDGSRREIAGTYELGSLNVLEIREWGKEIPTDKTIRIDVLEGAWQLWSWYLLPDHKVSASRPLYGFFPHPPRGLRGDYALIRREDDNVPPDRIGGPVFSNREFAIYRIRPNEIPLTATQALVFDVQEITYGF
jgi:hypothetical protein